MTREELFNMKVGEVLESKVRFINPETGRKKDGIVRGVWPYLIWVESCKNKDRQFVKLETVELVRRGNELT